MARQDGRETAGRPGLSRAVRRRQWGLVALLVAAGCVNYLDRSTLSVGNHDIARDLHLSPSQIGALLSAFAWAYAVFQLPVGAITDRKGPRIMLAIGMTFWSLAQIVSGAVQSFGQFIAARVALGLGESPMFTGGARASVNWFPVADRALPLGLFNASSSLGPAIAPPILTVLMVDFGWRPMFVIMGAAGLVVAVAWTALYRDPEKAGVSHEDIALIREGEVKRTGRAGFKLWGRLLAIPSTWAMVAGLFGIVYVTWLYVSWLPAYLEQVRHLSVRATGLWAAAPQAAGFVGACLGGLLSDRLAKLNSDAAGARKAPLVGGLILAGVFTAAAPLAANTGLALALMSAALFCGYGAGSCSWALGATLAPADAVATLEAVQNIGGSIGGALAPLVTGVIVQRTGAFDLAFFIAAGCAVASGLAYGLVRNDAYANLPGAGA